MTCLHTLRVTSLDDNKKTIELLDLNDGITSNNTRELVEFTDKLNNNYNDLINNPDNMLLEPSVLYDTNEYISIERKKILFLFKVYNNLQIYNKSELTAIIHENKSSVIFKYFDRKILMISDPFNQILILNIFALFIFKIYGDDITYTTLKYIIRVMLKDEGFNYNELDILIKLDSVHLITYYYELVDHLNSLLRVG